MEENNLKINFACKFTRMYDSDVVEITKSRPRP